MVLKEFTWLEREIRTVLQEVRSATKTQVLLFPGAGAHRLRQDAREGSSRKKMKRD